MKFNTGTTIVGKIAAILGTLLTIAGAIMLFFAGLTGFVFLPLAFGGIALVLGGFWLARSSRLVEFINDFLR